MIRFSKRSRSLSFAGASNAPASAHASKSEVSSLWRDGSRVTALSSSDLVSADDDVIDVDHEAVEIVDEAPRSTAQRAAAAPAAIPSASLPPPRMPPRRLGAPEPKSFEPRRAAMRSVPPTSFAPAPVKREDDPKPVRGAKVPTPRPPPRRTTPSIVQSVAPVAMDNDDASPESVAPRSSKAPARRRRLTKPTWPFAALLVLVGATFGFAASMFAHPSSSVGAATTLGAATLTADSTQVTEVVGKAEALKSAPAEPKPLTFSDTPLDIRVPVAKEASEDVAAAPAPVKPPVVATPAPAVKAPPVATPTPVARAPKAEPKIIELPSREQREAREHDAARAVAKPTPEPVAPPAALAPANASNATPRRELSPAAVDALVRQQLSSTLH